MNKIFIKGLIVILFYVLTAYPQPTWEKIKTPTDFNLLKVCYLDSLHCWVAGDSGLIMFSNDQGKNWQIQNSGVSNFISDIYFLNENLGWAVAFEREGINSDIRSKILKTTNGGTDWQTDNYRHLNKILTTIFFIDSLNGWIGGEPFVLSYTTNSGMDWVESVVDSGTFQEFPVSQIRFSSPSYGFACGGANDVASVIWRSTNGGQNWVSTGINADPFLDFQFLDSLNILALAGDREGLYPAGRLVTYNNGTFWNYDSIPFYGAVRGLDFRTSIEIWATLDRGSSFIRSSDFGSTWVIFPLPQRVQMNDVDFADALNGIAGSNSGYILKYIPEEPVNVESAVSEIPEKFILEQNYPNPFNPSTKIRWHSPSSSHQTLKVYDVLGNEVATLVEEYKSAGIYEVEFNIETGNNLSLTSGIYFYRVKSDNYFETKKMLLLK